MRRALLLTLTLLHLLLVLGLSAPVFAAGRREIHVSIRPLSVAVSIDCWAYYPGSGLTLYGNLKDFEKATNDLIVFVYDKEATSENTQNNCILKEILDKRHDAPRLDPHQPEGGLARCGGSGGKPKTWDAETAQALARVGAVTNLSSPAGEEGGHPYGIAGGMNPNATSSPAKQAAAATLQIALSASEIKQIVRNASRFVVARLTKQAEIDAVEKATEEAIEQLVKEGKAVSREAVENRAREAAAEAERELLRAGGGGGAESAASKGPTIVHVPGPRKPPPIGHSGTPIRSGSAQGGPKLGSSGGPGASKRFNEGIKDAAEVQADGKCVYCGRDTSRAPGGTQRNTDHAIPKSRGGNNSLENAQNACRDCNLDKGTRTTQEYLDSLRQRQGGR